MTDNEAIIKIIAKHTREYNELDRLYKKLGVKHLTLLGVHKETIEKMAKQEDIHHDLKEDYAIVVERAATIKLLYGQFKGENKKLKVLLQVATREIKKQREEVVEDLNNFNWKYDIEDAGVQDWIKLIEKWGAK